MSGRDFDQPAYQRIASEWAERIDRGELSNGDRLPTRPELEEQYGVSRQVVRDALTLLHQEGYLRSFAAKGTFVHRLPRLDLPMYQLERPGGADAFEDTVKAQGHKPFQDIRVETLVPEPGIAEALGLGANELALVRRRMRTVDGIPYALADSYFPHRIVAGTEIEHPDNIGRGGRHVLAELGYPMEHHADKVTSRRPHRRELQELGIAPGLAVIVHERTSSTASGEPVRHMVSILPSDRWRITYEVS